MAGTSEAAKSTPRSRALGAALREAREAAGLGVRELTQNLGWKSHATLSRYETGSRTPQPEDVATILQAVGVNGERREEILALARESDRSHWLSMGMTEQQRQLATLLDYERTAATITDVSPLLIPGLLQTGDYARAIMRESAVPEPEIETRVAVRLGRRDALTRREPATLLALVGEAALQANIGGPRVMLDQLRHLQRTAELPTVDLRAIPVRSRWTPALEGPFVVVVPADGDNPVVHIETRSSGLFLHEKDDVGPYMGAIEMVLRVAMSADETADLIAREAEEIERIANGDGTAALEEIHAQQQ
jgi:transcriptional regulator with XRE-family HTH domain